MSQVVKLVATALAVLTAIAVLCVADLRCSGSPAPESTVAHIRDEMAAGRREARNLQADELAVLSRNLHAMAHRYRERGETNKAHRALGAAQELDRKIERLSSDGRP